MSGSVILRVFTVLERSNGPSKKDCLFVSLLLLTVLARHWLDTDGETEAGVHLMRGGGCLPAEERTHRTRLPAADLISVGGVADNSSDCDSDSDGDSAVGAEGEDCESGGGSEPDPPSEVSCLASELRRSLRMDDEGDGGFVEPTLCPGQLGLLTLGGEYKPMAVAYAECSSGLSWCPPPEQCLPILRDSVILRRESWPFLAGAVRSPTQTWRSVRMRVPHSCYCGRRQHHSHKQHQLQLEEVELPVGAAGVVSPGLP